MKRFLKAFALIALIAFVASCKKDDDNNYVPPRDYGVQYASEKDSIEKYLKNHYIVSVDESFTIQIDSITNPSTQTSIWDQDEYELKSFTYKSINTSNYPEYTLYYLVLNQGSGDRPTRADDVLISYRANLLNDTQVDYNPYPQTTMSLYNDVAVEGWKAILPRFNAGTYVDVPGSPDPAHFENYGAGVMFIPSGLAYYNGGSGLVGSYQPLVFSFKLYSVTYTDADGDGIQNRYERGDVATTPMNESLFDLKDLDTDGDGIPDFEDTDDDGDGYLTRTEILTVVEENGVKKLVVPSYEGIPTNHCIENGTTKIHLDRSCFKIEKITDGQ